MPHLNGGKATGFIKEIAKGFFVNRKMQPRGFPQNRHLLHAVATHAAAEPHRLAAMATRRCQAPPSPRLVALKGAARPPLLRARHRSLAPLPSLSPFLAAMAVT